MFAKLLKELRTLKQVTQKEVAEAVGVSERVYGYYEMGERFPKDPDVLKKLADYFDVSLDYLLGRIDKDIPLPDRQYAEIEKILSNTEKFLLQQDGLMFNGEPASEDAIESIIDAMRFGMEQARKRNKKYTPKVHLQRSVTNDQDPSSEIDS